MCVLTRLLIKYYSFIPEQKRVFVIFVSNHNLHSIYKMRGEGV